MDTRSGLLRYGFVALVWVAGIEWLLGRAISRLAASPALEGLPRTIIEALGSIGLFLLAPATLLAFTLLMLSAASGGSRGIAMRDRWRVALAIYTGLFGVVSAALVLMPRTVWLSMAYTLLALVAFWWLALHYALRKGVSVAVRWAALLVAGAYTGYLLNLLLEQLDGSGMSPVVSPIFVRDLGEASLVAAPFAFFAAVAVPGRQWLMPGRWILPLVVAGAFCAANIADMMVDQGFTGVFAIWSIGLSYYLPWPLYAISLALYLYAIITCFSGGDDKPATATREMGAGLLLLTFASYELQFPYQYVLAVLSLMLLTGMVAPFAGGLVVAHGRDDADNARPQSGEPRSRGQSPPPVATT